LFLLFFAASRSKSGSTTRDVLPVLLVVVVIVAVVAIHGSVDFNGLNLTVVPPRSRAPKVIIEH